MTGVEQVIERSDDTMPRISPPAPKDAAQAEVRAADAGGAPLDDGGFSPDPARRTDRYRLVTPYCLRL